MFSRRLRSIRSHNIDILNVFNSNRVITFKRWSGNEEVVIVVSLVACELRYSVEKKGSTSLTAKVELLLNEIDILPLEYEAVSWYYVSLRVFLSGRSR
jgi:predicted nucleic acid-binding protein